MRLNSTFFHEIEHVVFRFASDFVPHIHFTIVVQFLVFDGDVLTTVPLPILAVTTAQILSTVLEVSVIYLCSSYSWSVLSTSISPWSLCNLVPHTLAVSVVHFYLFVLEVFVNFVLQFCLLPCLSLDLCSPSRHNICSTVSALSSALHWRTLSNFLPNDVFFS